MRIKYKDKNDIPYFKFAEFQAIVGDSKDPDLITRETMRLFYPEEKELTHMFVHEFAIAINKKCKAKLNFNIDMTFKKAEKFIDCEAFLKDQELIEFLKLVIKPKRFWQRIDFKKISVADVEYVCQLFIHAQRI